MKDDVEIFFSLSIAIQQLPLGAFVDQQDFKLFNYQLDEVLDFSHHPVRVLDRT